MPTITLPAQGDKPWDGILNTAITDINDAVDENTEALGALPDTFVTSVNSATGAVTVTPAGIGAAAASHTHAASAIVSGTLDEARIPTLAISKTSGLQGELDSKLESVALSDIEATGTPSGTTYLRGDGSWSTPAGGGAVDSVNGATGTVVLDAADVGALASDVTLDNIPAGSTNVQFTSTMSSKLAGIASGAQVNTVASVAGKTGAVSLVKGDVGLGSVDNTSDASKPVSTAAQAALDAKEYVLTAGANITINRTNPLAPIISASGGSGGAGDWGSIGGDLSAQTDLVAALDAKQDTITDSDDITQGTTNLFFTGAERTKLSGLEAGAEVNAVDSVNGATGVVVLDADDISEGATNLYITGSERTKLSGVASGATQNSSDATLLARANHTGTQAISTVSGLQTALDAKADDSDLTGYVPTTRTVNGSALSGDITLDADDIADGTTNKAYTATEKTKLSGIATGATANQSDATTNAAIALKANAANPVFTGSVTIPDGALAIADTGGLQTALDAKANTADLTTYTTQVYVDEAVSNLESSKLSTAAASIYLVPVYYGDNLSMTRPDVPNMVAWIGSDGTLTNKLETDLRFVVDVATFVGPFDAYTAPFRAVSLRRLLASYTGPLIRVRRTSDGVEQDIAAESDGDLDTTALLAFAGSSSATVVTWYDQSGNARHMTQATAANQPTIVNSGTLFTVNSKAAIDFDGTTDFLSSSSVGLWAAGAGTVAMVGLLSAPGTNATVLVESGGTGASSSHIRFIRQSTANLNFQISSTVALTATGSNLFDNAQHHTFLVDTGAAVSSWKDISTAMHAAVGYTRPAVGTFTPTVFNIGVAGSSAQSNYLDGALQEVIMWGSAYTTDRAALSGDQRTYWGTP